MNYISPLKLKSINLSNNIFQAPLAGYSCAPFRVLTTRYGNPGFCSTEMISAKDLVNRKQGQKRYLWRDPNEGTLCYQLSGNDPEIMKQAATLVSEAGADIIDLNCGCPVAKIRAKNCGSKLLQNPEIIYSVVNAIKSNTNAAVSIKVRIASTVNDHDDFAVIDAAETAGVDFITVHGRHWTERYDVDSDLDAIAKIVKKSKVPIIANGDAEDAQSFKNIMDKTSCAGVMIARACVGQPWLFAEIMAACQSKEFIKPSFAEIGETFLEHLNGLIDLQNEKLAVLQSRKLAKYYARNLPNRLEFVTSAQQAESVEQINRLVAKYFI